MYELEFSTVINFIYFEIFATIIFSVVGGILGDRSLRNNVTGSARLGIISACSF